MENKINIAEFLKDSPRGIELDCTVFDNVTFDYVNTEQNRIYCKIDNRDTVWFTAKGCINLAPSAKCVIFPKGKTTWEGFQRPFKDGDVLYVDCTDECDDKQYDYLFILDEIYNGGVYSYCQYFIPNDEFQIRDSVVRCLTDDKYPIRFATEEEKQKLFDAIKANGYRWNDKTKTLEKLPKFKVGDKVKYKNTNICRCIKRYDDILNYYVTSDDYIISLEKQDDWKLVPNKFDVTTLKPFESRVLVRDTEGEKWKPAIWGYYDVDHIEGYPYETVGGNCFHLCIPYEGNEHLLSNTDDCDDFYKTWE